MRRLDHVAELGFRVAAFSSAVATVGIFGFMAVLGYPLLTDGRLVEVLTSPWLPDQGAFGIFPMLAGTVLIASLAVLLAFPLSLGCASFVVVTGPRPLAGLLRKTVSVMTGVPTVIYGFVGVFLLVPVIRETFHHGSGMCILSAALCLAVLVSPTMILFFVDSFERVPLSQINAVDALGGTPVQKLLYVILPQAWPGVITGLVLGLGRAVGDTLIALMIAGNSVAIPHSMLDSARTLTAHIALIIAADFESLEFRTLFACGIVLYAFTALTVLLVRTVGTARKGAR